MVYIVHKSKRNFNLTNRIKEEAERLFKNQMIEQGKNERVVIKGKIPLKHENLKDINIEKIIETEKKKAIEPLKEILKAKNMNELAKEVSGKKPKKNDVELLATPQKQENKIDVLTLWNNSIHLLQGAVINGFPIHDLGSVHKHLIKMLFESLDEFDKTHGWVVFQKDKKQHPKVSVEDSISPDGKSLYCLNCGEKCVYLAKHIRTDHGLSKAQYIYLWGLPKDYPFFPEKYSESRKNQMMINLSKMGNVKRGRKKKIRENFDDEM